MATPVKTVPVQPSRELAHVRYFIDSSVNAGVKGKLTELLQAYGACPAKTVSQTVTEQGTAEAATTESNATPSQQQTSTNEKLDLNDLTHVITMSMQFQDHEDINARNASATRQAEEAGKQIGTAPGATGRRGDLIAIVTPLWVTKTCDYKKRQEEAYFSPDPKKIFSGVTVCTDGLPPGDSEAVKGIVSALGGQWRAPLVAEVTHLVCLNLEGKKAQRLMGTGLRLGMKAVLPHWIDDCIKLHLRVSEDPYLFPKPPCFDTSMRAPVPYEVRLAEHYTKLGKQMPPVSNYSSSVLEPHVLEGESQPSSQHPDDNTVTVTASNSPSVGVFAGKAVYVAQACELSPEKLQMFLLKIREAGGEPLAGANIKENGALLEKADIAVINYREGWEYWKAYEAKKIIGNIDWLIYVVFTSSITESTAMPIPTDRMLHYPWPRKPLPAFKDTNFTVSGYVGASREIIKRMIELLGGTFEGTLTKGKTTHLIASVQSGSKVMHARPWKIPILNHHWIEDCFAQWQFLDLQAEKYNTFDASAIDRDLPSFVQGRPISASHVEQWANTPEVVEERDESLKNVDNAIIDEMDEAQEDDLLLSSPAMSAEGTPAPPPQLSQNADGDTTLQQISAMLQQDGMHVDEPYSPLPPSVIAQSQFPPSPSASDTASIAAAVAENLKRGKEPRTDYIIPAPTTSTATKVEETKRKPVPDAPSSISTNDALSDTSINDKKRKRPSLAGLGDNGGLAQSTSGYMGRKAAQAATQKLHDTIMPDLLQYEKEKRGGGGKQLEEMFGGRAPTSSPKKPASTNTKVTYRKATGAGSSSSAGSDPEPLDDNIPPPPAPPRKGKTQVLPNQPPPTPHVVASKSSKGKAPAKASARPVPTEPEYKSAGDVAKKPNSVSKVTQSGGRVYIASTGVPIDEKSRKVLVKMGAKVLGDNIEGCTHIVVSKISRTVKFLTAIPLGAYFVTEGWVTGSVESGQFIDEEAHILKDKEGEKKHGMNLAKSVMRARRSKIFDDYTFYITPQVQPSFEALKAISEAAGAKVIKKLPTVKQVSDRADVFVISSEAERSSWEHLTSQGVPVYSGEAIIKAIMQQEKEFDLYLLEGDDA